MRIAAFTMVHNEADFLPLWIRHYGREIGVENLYCVDHGSDDGSTEGIGISITRFPRRRDFDSVIRSFLIANFHASLLRSHDAVIFSDADEFLVADPGGLGPRHRRLSDSLIGAGLAAPLGAGTAPGPRAALDETGRVAAEARERV